MSRSVIRIKHSLRHTYNVFDNFKPDYKPTKELKEALAEILSGMDSFCKYHKIDTNELIKLAKKTNA